MRLFILKREVVGTSHYLGRIVRLLFYCLRVSNEDYVKSYFNYCESLGWQNDAIIQQKNNHGKCLKNPNGQITFPKAIFTIVSILNLRIKDITFTLEKSDGTEFVVSYNDKIEDLEKRLNAPPAPEDPAEEQNPTYGNNRLL